MTANELSAQGAFAEAQAAYLNPDPDTVADLRARLERARAGVVAHFYMGAELQGTLYACDWPHIHVSDSLAMADRAIAMAEAGMQNLIVLGVDFMSENVRAMVDAAGRRDVGVYRVSREPIGCSLAESAESRAYGAYLRKAAATPRSLHVVYINTSLWTKAHAHNLVPTITCTSSNVVQTVLQAFAQEPELHLWFGPDTYMGANLAALFEGLTELDEAAIRALHPAHDRRSIAALRGRFDYFKQGNCVVHHMFGDDVTARVRDEYQDARVTAHLEVPGEMFRLALAAQREGRGVIGSTSDILHYITGQVAAAARDASGPRRLKFILGTESGMVTAIVRAVRQVLRDSEAQGARGDIEAEIVFPVASEAIATTRDAERPIVPGVAAGEGCSTAGGCATCPYMKMNSLDATLDVLDGLRVGDASALVSYEPRKYTETLAGRSVAALGSEPILHMRGFQRTGALPGALIDDVRTRVA
ncbi:MAG: quinolinate synthase NadA [Myxococcales bacterium]|nr:quinolinate synthase NadA [Myxococcales bacterium]